jgi:hypothetical protein
MEISSQTPANTQHDDLLANLYSLNKQWTSEINFMEDEMKFLTDLLDKFFINMIKDEHVNRVQLIRMQLVSLGMVRKNIKRDILKHQANIEEKINNIPGKSDDFLKLEDERMIEELKDFNRSFKQLKSEIFNLSRALLHSHKPE